MAENQQDPEAEVMGSGESLPVVIPVEEPTPEERPRQRLTDRLHDVPEFDLAQHAREVLRDYTDALSDRI